VEHLHHFGLAEDPFRSDAADKFDVALPSQQDALARLDRGVRQGRGLIVLIGGVGAGKTRVARHLYDGLEEEQFEAAMMVVLRREVGTEWLLARIARQLGVERAEADREAVIRQIYERLAIIHEDGRRAVVIIDDAHGIANADTLSELCGLVKLEYEERRLVTVVLAGAPPLDAAIAADPLVAHHVEVRVPLAALSREEAVAYLGARVEAAGAGAEIWLPGATAALHELSGGSPGRINALADNALYEAWLARRAQVTRSDVERAHADLGWALHAHGVHLARRTTPVEAEQTNPMAFEVSDPELAAVFEPRPRRAEPEPELTAAPPARAVAERTPIELDEPEPPPKGDDVDELFMELLDD
jgi:general secretion pathway protein A